MRASPPWPRPSYPWRWLRDHVRVAGESLRYVSQRLSGTLLAWLLVGIALALPAGLLLVQSSLSELTGRWDNRPGLSVYFEPGANPAVLATALRQQPDVKRIEVVTQQQALAEFRAHALLGEAIEVLESNPLPASLRVVPIAGTDFAALEQLAEQARQHPGTLEVVFEKTWLERVANATKVVRRVGAILAALFGLGAVLVTTTTVRLAIEARLGELRVMKLVGASDPQVRRPFLYLGLLYGFGGGMAAAMLLSGGIMVLEPPLARLLSSFDMTFAAPFGIRFLGLLLGVGAVLGILGAAAAVRQRRASLQIL